MTHSSEQTQEDLIAAAEQKRYAYARAVKELMKFKIEYIDRVTELPQELITNCQLVQNRYELIKFLPKNGLIAEIGTDRGDFARRLLEYCKPKELHIFEIDVSRINYDNVDKAITNGVATIHEGPSAEQIMLLPDGYFDWIYIDGDHSYEGVKRDIDASLQKLRPGGLLVLNDYTVWSPASMSRCGVARAVNAFCIAEGWELVYLAFQSLMYNDVVIRKRGSDSTSARPAPRPISANPDARQRLARATARDRAAHDADLARISRYIATLERTNRQLTEETERLRRRSPGQLFGLLGNRSKTTSPRSSKRPSLAALSLAPDRDQLTRAIEDLPPGTAIQQLARDRSPIAVGIFSERVAERLEARVADRALRFDSYDAGWPQMQPTQLVIEVDALADDEGWKRALTSEDASATLELAAMLRKANNLGIETILVPPLEPHRYPLLSRVRSLFDREMDRPV